MAEINVWEILRRRYPSKEYALMQEVSDASGHSRSRSADFIVVNLWPSRGLHITGFELKSHRSDWLMELKRPQKQENIFKYCDYFYLITSDPAIAKTEEIPANWGLMTIVGSKIKVIKDAPKQQPTLPTMHFICAMLKRAAGNQDELIHRDSIADKIRIAEDNERARMEDRISHIDKQLKTIKENAAVFEKHSGINLGMQGHYIDKHFEKIGTAVNFVMNGGLDKEKAKLESLKTSADQISTYISNIIKESCPPTLPVK